MAEHLVSPSMCKQILQKITTVDNVITRHWEDKLHNNYLCKRYQHYCECQFPRIMQSIQSLNFGFRTDLDCRNNNIIFNAVTLVILQYLQASTMPATVNRFELQLSFRLHALYLPPLQVTD